MKCDHCKQNEANFHYQTNINGTVTQRRLCMDCAMELGLEPPQIFDPVASVLGSFLGPRQAAAGLRSAVCPFCGATQRSVAETGKAGCAQCYTALEGLLGPYIRRLHGDAAHRGRIPAGAGAAVRARREAERLRGELNAAVQRQAFEEAARLRDQIRALEGGGAS